MPEIQSMFFNGKTYSADDFVESNKNVMTDGILPYLNYFAVAPSETMTIGVTAGRGWVGGHSFNSGSTLAFTLDQADGTLDRVDTIIIRLDLTTDNEKIECLLIKGALGSEATAPIRNGTYYDLIIAEIAVAHGTTAITAAMITDKRADISKCGWSGAISSEQFNFDSKADKSEVATKAAVADGSIIVNANLFKDKEILPLTSEGILMLKGNQIKVLPSGATVLNSTASCSAGSSNTFTITNNDFKCFNVSLTASLFGEASCQFIATKPFTNSNITLVITHNSGSVAGKITTIQLSIQVSNDGKVTLNCISCTGQYSSASVMIDLKGVY